MGLSLFSLGYLAQLPLAWAAKTWTVGQTVNTTSGVLLGHSSEWAPDVSEYLGIPFAQAPVDDLRWAAPVRHSSTAAFNASDFGDTCPRLGGNVLNATNKAFANVTNIGAAILGIQGASNDTFSEDCLTLNVWTKPQTGDVSKPVIIFIHGGAFSSGACTNPFESGAVLANEQDVVFVTFNYRLSIFGFPGHTDTDAVPYNLGLLDQRLAIEWVRDNVEAFGGDPSRITLFGSSAGAASVDYHSYAYADDPIVSSFIPASGTVTAFGSITSDAATEKWLEVSETLGCGSDRSADADAMLACLRSKSTDEVMDAIPPVTGFSAVQSSFTATVDGVLVFADYADRAPARLPLLIGSNDAEAELFEVTSALKGKTFADSFWAGVTNAIFTCPVALRANWSLNADQPTWRYRFSAAFPNTQLSSNRYSGAWHGSQNVVLFGNSRLSGGADTEAERAFAAYLRGAWAAFARDPRRGLADYGWPVYSPGEETLVELGGRDGVNASFVRGDEYDQNCASVAAVDGTPTVETTSGTPSATATGSGSDSSSSTSTSGNMAGNLSPPFCGIIAALIGILFSM